MKKKVDRRSTGGYFQICHSTPGRFLPRRFSNPVQQKSSRLPGRLALFLSVKTDREWESKVDFRVAEKCLRNRKKVDRKYTLARLTCIAFRDFLIPASFGPTSISGCVKTESGRDQYQLKARRYNYAF